MSIREEVFEHTSEGLSALIAQVLEDDNVMQPATLADVSKAVKAKVKTDSIPLNRFSDDGGAQLGDEIDGLIEEYGSDALAVRFLKPWASEPLCRLIEAGLDELGETTLGGLFEVAEQGLLANLIGQGEIEDDEAQTVLAELNSLIERHGEDALCEEFLGSS